MGTGENAATELRALKAELLVRMAKLQQKLVAIDLILEEYEQEQTEGGKQIGLKGTLNGLYREMSLKDASLHVLEGNSRRWWKVSEVTEQVVARGFPFQTDRPMGSVAATIKRLSDSNKIRRKSKGRNFLYRYLDQEGG